jgi:RNase P subunit RPR2
MVDDEILKKMIQKHKDYPLQEGFRRFYCKNCKSQFIDISENIISQVFSIYKGWTCTNCNFNNHW